MSKNICDIIIPIYNAYEDLIECINSIVDNTKNELYNLILIDDKSSDQRIVPYLKGLEKKSVKNIKVLYNENNLGFVGTVNRGMKESLNDVVLLNSDTLVTKRWLEKIIDCAYSNERIATVTPLTNNGTICSIPNFCEDNDIPNNVPLDRYADMIEKVSFKRYPVVPTGVGYCMYIKRQVLNLVGYFDEESFNKGYGEENDFCCRATENGYINVICDDTFILHKGSLSFKEDKRKYIEQNLKILDEKHPYYLKRVEEFVNVNPLKDIQENIRFYTNLISNDKKNILYVLHNGMTRPINHPIGGTEYHVLDLVRGLDNYNKFVLISLKNKLILQIFIDNYTKEIEFELDNIINLENITNKEYASLIKDILVAFNINLVHVHHLIKHTLDIILTAKMLNIPVVTTLHDYYTITPTIDLLNENGIYTGINSSDYNKAIKNKLGYDTGFLSMWNKEMLNMLKLSDYLITPSFAAKEIIEEYYKEIDGKIKVIEHGINEKEIKNLKNDSENFNIAFIGGLAPYKGSGIIYKLIKENKNKNIKWHMFGNLGDQRLNMLDREDVIKHGRYDRNDIQELLIKNKIHMVGILSIWPETYSYTLTEAWSAKLPVMVTDIGALGERVKKTKAGILLDLKSETKEMLNEIHKISEDKGFYNEIMKNVQKMKIKSMATMIEEYNNIYLNLILNNQIKEFDYDRKNIYRAVKFSEINKDNLNIEHVEILQRKNKELETELNVMRSTLGWKFLNRIRKYPNVIALLKNIVKVAINK